ncbi:PKD domain-containing protein [Paraconexibacter algicola]|uniref:PKD domain-containing protein n=1 Tax=Paraconexibacter algicola TaxID=2133960 RepID=A0A2T4UN23_9ACTN|nr:PKD domain-containing protein [Paraconexibacter algicola]PTL60629.1 hypothetical protein C7Y72_13795 [Paraconexibacter algicola]
MRAGQHRTARRAALTLGCALLALPATAPPRADARITPVTPIAGPSTAIVELGGVAMAPDGTGGLVFRRRDEDGRTHIYASRFDGVTWAAPVRVDRGQRFDSSWPAIAAAGGGRLVVVWVQEFGVATDRLFAATLDPGATGFQAPVPVDLNVGEAIATYPTVAMNRAGTAYVVYRVVNATPQQNTSLPSDTVDADVRVARTSGQFWSVLGAPMDRDIAVPVATPTALNAPRIGVDVAGNAVVAWQEPDATQTDRVFARRLFGGTMGIALQVSPSERDGRPVRGRTDQLALAVAGFGQAVVGYRELGEGDEAAADARVWTNAIPESFSDKAAAFAGPRLADGGPAAPDQPLSAPPGPVSVATTPAGAVAAGVAVGPASLVVSGDDRSVGAPVRLDDGTSTASGDPVVGLSSADAAAAYAWRVQQGRVGAVAAREVRADGVPTTRVLSAPRGGRVTDLRLAGSGVGDAAIAWVQGEGDGTQIAAAVIDAPPAQFAAQAPLTWVRTPTAKLAWDTAPHAIGGVSYDLTVDDEQVATGLTRTRTELPLADVEDGRRTLVVIARDSAGQETESIPTELRVDRTAPTVTVGRSGRRGVRVAITDGAAGESSGPSAAGTTVRFGDGRGTRGRVSRIVHTYRKAGRYRVTVTTRDRVGNRRVLRRTVVVR